MSKRGQEEQGGQERYGGTGFGGAGTARVNDAPKQATAAQLARRSTAKMEVIPKDFQHPDWATERLSQSLSILSMDGDSDEEMDDGDESHVAKKRKRGSDTLTTSTRLATGKTPRKTNNLSRSASPAKNMPGNANQNQSMGFTPGGTGFNFGTSTTADGSQSNTFPTMAFPQQPPPTFGQGNGVAGANMGGAALSQPASNSSPSPAPAPPTNSVLDAFRKSQEAKGVNYNSNVKTYSGPSGNSPYKTGHPPASSPPASPNPLGGPSGFANFLKSQEAKGITYGKDGKVTDAKNNRQSHLVQARDLDGNHFTMEETVLEREYYNPPGSLLHIPGTPLPTEFLYVLRNLDPSQQPSGRDHLMAQRECTGVRDGDTKKWTPWKVYVAKEAQDTDLSSSSAPPPGTGLFGSSTSTPPSSTNNGESVFAHLNQTGPKPAIDFRNLQSSSSTQPPGNGPFGSSAPSSFSNPGNSFGGGFGQNWQNNTNGGFDSGSGQGQQNDGISGGFGQNQNQNQSNPQQFFGADQMQQDSGNSQPSSFGSFGQNQGQQNQQNNGFNSGFGQTQNQNNGTNGGFGQNQNQSNPQQSFGGDQMQQDSGNIQPSSFGSFGQNQSQQHGNANTGFNSGFGQTQNQSNGINGGFGQNQNQNQSNPQQSFGGDQMEQDSGNSQPSSFGSFGQNQSQQNGQANTGFNSGQSSEMQSFNSNGSGTFGQPSSAQNEPVNPNAGKSLMDRMTPRDNDPPAPTTGFFGAASSMAPTSGFGRPTSPSTSSNAQNPFAASAPANGGASGRRQSSPFAQVNQKSAFGQPSYTPTYTSTSPTGSAQPTSVFGAPSSTYRPVGPTTPRPPPVSSFGKPSSPSPTSTTPPGNAFGAASSTTNTGSFGKPSSPSATSSAPSSNLFGGAAANASKSTFGQPSSSTSAVPPKEASGGSFSAKPATPSSPPVEKSQGDKASASDDKGISFLDRISYDDGRKHHQWADGSTTPVSNSASPPAVTVNDEPTAEAPAAYKPPKPQPFVDPLDRSDFVTDRPGAAAESPAKESAYTMSGAIPAATATAPPASAPQTKSFTPSSSTPAATSKASAPSSFTPAAPSEPKRPVSPKSTTTNAHVPTATSPGGLSRLERFNEGAIAHLLTQDPSQDLTQLWLFYAETAKKLQAGLTVASAPAGSGSSGGSEGLKNPKASAPQPPTSAPASNMFGSQTQNSSTTPKGTSSSKSPEGAGTPQTGSRTNMFAQAASPETPSWIKNMRGKKTAAPSEAELAATSTTNKPETALKATSTPKRGGFNLGSSDPFVSKTPVPMKPNTFGSPMPQPPATAPASKKRSADGDLTRNDQDKAEPTTNKRHRGSGENEQASIVKATDSNFGASGGLATSQLQSKTSTPKQSNVFGQPPATAPVSKKRSADTDDTTEPTNGKRRRASGQNYDTNSAFGIFSKALDAPTSSPSPEPEPASNSQLSKLDFAPAFKKSQSTYAPAKKSPLSESMVPQQTPPKDSGPVRKTSDFKKKIPTSAELIREHRNIKFAEFEPHGVSRDDFKIAYTSCAQSISSRRPSPNGLRRRQIGVRAAMWELIDISRASRIGLDELDDDHPAKNQDREHLAKVKGKMERLEPKLDRLAAGEEIPDEEESESENEDDIDCPPGGYGPPRMPAPPVTRVNASAAFKPTFGASGFSPMKSGTAFKPSTESSGFTPSKSAPFAGGSRPSTSTSVSSGGFMNAFGDQAKKAEEAAKKKRMDEDYDSEEETKEQWEKRDAEKQAKLREEMKKTASSGGFKPGSATPSSGFTPASAAPKTSGSFLSSFGDQAKKAEDAARQRRMDEDYDSDEESKEEWLKKDAAKQAKLKEEMEKAATPSTGFRIAAPSAPTPFIPTWTPPTTTSTPPSFKPFASATPTAPATAPASTPFAQPPTRTSMFGAAAISTPSQDKRKRSRDADEEDEDTQARRDMQKKVKSVDAPQNNIFERGMNDTNFAADGSGPVTEKQSTENDEDAAPAEKQVEDLTDLTEEEHKENEVLVDLPVAKASKMGDGKGWQQHGKGRTYVLQSKATGRVRLMMKTSPLGKVIINNAVLPSHPEMYEVVGAKRAAVKATLVLQGEGGAGKPVPFFLQCRTTTDAESVVAGLLRGCSQ